MKTLAAVILLASTLTLAAQIIDGDGCYRIQGSRVRYCPQTSAQVPVNPVPYVHLDVLSVR